ncbi:MAG: polysaccharide biosynthesis tyrosine autokinase [Pyrinomonadaceae bacterium]|nr:polysaccharide biosynthesis tyrosine autokinase [Sphingobacteriaceae bacterium]
MLTEDRGLFGEEKSTVSIKELVVKYLAKWPLISICLLICVGSGILYIRYSAPKYLANTSFLVKDQGKSSSTDLIEAAINGSGKKQVSINNEIIQFGSAMIMERTVAKHGLNISYYKKGKVLDIDIYKDAPFKLMVKKLKDTTQSVTFFISDINNIGGTIRINAEDSPEKYNFKWNAVYDIEGNSFILMSDQPINKESGTYIVTWEPIEVAASGFSNDLAVKSFDPKTNIIQADLKTTNLQKGKDILNALFTEYNLSDMEDRNKLSQNTVKFIDERLYNISSELKGVESNLENYQGSNQIVNIEGQSSMSLEASSEASKTIKDLSIQRSVIDIMQSFFADPANSNKLVPSSIGLTDGTISALVGQYNLLQLKRERVAPMVAPNSSVMQDLNTQLASLKGSIIESLSSIQKNLRMQEASMQRQNSQYKNFLSSVPRNERVLQEIKRKQGITEGLYLYLLQKREEAAISSTGNNVPNYRQIDLATGFGPVEPNKKNILLYTTLLGLTLAFGIIYLGELLNDKITSRHDVQKRLSLPVLGDINHIPRKKKLPISVLTRNITSEQFRAIRTNLSFVLKHKNDKVILVTSTMNGEGKSFFSTNLATIFALPGKKVALLEFDIRKPVIASSLDISSDKGLSNYLSGEEKDLDSIYKTYKELTNLHIYPCGPLPANPGDMLLSENVNKLFDNLRESYDYVIIDSPPSKLVSDSFILGKFSDVVMYVVRHDYTLINHLQFIKEIVANKTLSNINIVYNDLKTDEKNAYEGYYGEGKA